MRVILIIRRSAEYLLEGKLSMPSCKEDEEFWDEYQTTILRAIDWWDELFEIPYMEFRKMFRRIPAQLIADAQFDIVFNHFDWEALEELKDLEDTWVVPQDEDDWPSPILPATLRKVNIKRFEGVIWDTQRICETNTEWITCDLDYYRGHVLLSNAYSMRINNPNRAMTLHGIAQNLFQRFESVRYIERPLAVKVDGPASMSLLRIVESKEHLRGLIARFKREDLTLALPPEYQEAYSEYKRLVHAL